MKNILEKIDSYLKEGFADTKNFTSDSEICRLGIQAEFDAINLYEQLAKKAKDPVLKKVLLHIAQEEKVHVGEFETILERLDPEHEPAEEEGEKEVEDLESFGYGNRTRR